MRHRRRVTALLIAAAMPCAHGAPPHAFDNGRATRAPTDTPAAHRHRATTRGGDAPDLGRQIAGVAPGDVQGMMPTGMGRAAGDPRRRAPAASLLPPGTFMHLIFTKGAGRHDTMDVVRDGVPAERIDCPKQGIIPHDMVHYAVERVLHRRGFIGRVLAGEAASFRMQAQAESDGVERLVEVFQGDGWSGGTTPAAQMLDLYALTCDARACAPLPVDADGIERVRACIAALTAQWQAMPVGGALVLRFDEESDGD